MKSGTCRIISERLVERGTPMPQHMDAPKTHEGPGATQRRGPPHALRVRRPALRILLALLMLGSVTVISAAPTHRVGTAADSGITINVTPWYDAKPIHGYLPVEVVIENGSGQAGQWQFSSAYNSYGAGTTGSSHSIAVDAGRTGTVTLMCPAGALVSHRATAYGDLRFTVSGPGVRINYAGTVPVKTVRTGGEWTFVGYSAMLANSYPWLRSVTSASSGSAVDTVGTEVKPEDQPEDWRGLMAMSAYGMRELEYEKLTGGQKAALVDYLLQGGQVIVCCADDAAAKRVMESLGGRVDGERVKLGLGQLIVTRTNAAENTVRKYFTTEGRDESLEKVLSDQRGESRAMIDAVGPLSTVSGFVFAFMLLFAILVGPVNLFVWADATRRHRLFITTPIISLVASAVLGLVILFQDGFGASGQRLTLAVMVPEQKRLVIRQEQGSRSGVLWGNGFTVTEPCAIHQIQHAAAPSAQQQQSFEEQGNRRGGDWFQSRSVQMQTLQSVRGSRGAIHLKSGEENGAAPSVLSSYDLRLAKVYLKAADGKMWEAQDLAPGEKKALKPSPWTAKSPELGAALVDRAFREATTNSTYAVAFIADVDAPKLALGTLEQVKWQRDEAVLVGPYLTEGP